MDSRFSRLADAISAPRNQVVRTSDLDHWIALTRDTLQTSFSFRLPNRRHFVGEIDHVDCGAFSIGRRRHGVEVFSESAPTPDDSFYIVLPFAGRCATQIGRQSLCITPDLASIASSRVALGAHASEAFDHAIVLMDRGRLEHTCRMLLGRDLDHPLDFAPALPTTSAPFERVLQTLTLAATLGDLPRRFPLVAANAEQLLLGALLLAQPNNYSDRLDDRGAFVPSAAVRRALDYMEAHLDQPITMTDVAKHAGVGLRSLQAAFRAQLAVSPSGWLRNRRLDHVHDALKSAEPHCASVTRIAFDWGFGHLGEFAAAYRQRFGVRPSETLGKYRRA